MRTEILKNDSIMMFETENMVNFAQLNGKLIGMETQEEHNIVNYEQNEEELKSVVMGRIRQLEVGEVDVIPNEQVLADIRERYGF